VSWQLDQTLELGFVLTAVEQALAQATPVIWNSDQGSHFTSPQCKFHRRIQHFSSGGGSRCQALHTRGKEALARVKERARRPGDVLLRRYNSC